MQPYIDMVTNYRVGRESYLDSLITMPPATLTVSIEWGSKEVKTFERPEGFDGKERYYGSRHTTCAGEFESRKSTAEWDITKANREIARMQERLTNWKPTNV